MTVTGVEMSPLCPNSAPDSCPVTLSSIWGWWEDPLENIHSQPGLLDAKSMSKILLDMDTC